MSEASGFIEVMSNVLFGFFLLIVYFLSSSMIPEKLTGIRKTAKYYITECGNGNSPHIHRNVIFYQKSIEKEDIVYTAAFGMFSFTRQFILSAIGMTLTYDLLIINFK